MNTVTHGQRHFSQDPHNPLFFNHPYDFYRQLHNMAGPIYWRDYGLWCLTEFDAVNAAFRDKRFARVPPDGFVRPCMPSHLSDFEQTEQGSLLALEPPEHTRLRQSVNRAFVHRKVQKMADNIEILAHQSIDKFEHLGQIELLAHYATEIPVNVIAQLIGVPREHCGDLLTWSHRMVRVYTMMQSHEEEIVANQAAKAFSDLLQNLINERRKKPCDDLLSQLLAPISSESNPKQAANEPISDEDIISTCILLLNAGHEATVHQMGNALYTVLTHASSAPSQNPANWFATTEFAERTVAEALRFDAPLHFFTRYAQQDLELYPGINIVKGEQIALLLGAANRDPKQFHEPDVFNPNRNDQNTVSFGAGLHFCIGTGLAKLELNIALSTLFKRLPTLRLAEEPRYKDSFHFHGLEALHLAWD